MEKLSSKKHNRSRTTPQETRRSASASVVIRVIVVNGILALITILRHPRGLRGPLNDLVELAAIKPDDATLWTIVHLNTLPFRHDQRHFLAYRTIRHYRH